MNARPARFSASVSLAFVLVAASFAPVLAGCGGVQAPAAASATPMSASVPAPVSGGGGAGVMSGATGEATGEATQPKIIRDAQLGIEVNDEKQIAPVLARAKSAAAKLGGYVSSESTSEVVIKVPSAKLDLALATVESGAQGEHVERREITARDVTASYTDLAIRIDNARKLAARLRELETQTAEVARLLDVEKELARVTTDLETLEGQMRLLDNQTTFATATVDVSTAVRPGPVGWVFYGLFHGVKWLFVWT